VPLIHNTCEAKWPTVEIFDAVALGAVLKTWTFDKWPMAMPSWETFNHSET